MRTTTTILAGSLALAAIAVALVGCGGSAVPTPPDTSGLAALDAHATLAVWSAQQEASARETAVAGQATTDAANASARATEDAVAQSTAVAQVTVDHLAAVAADLAQRNAELDLQERDLAIRANETAVAQESAARAAADDAALAFQKRQGELALAAKEAEIERERMWNRLLPWLVGTLVGGIVLSTGAVAWVLAAERLRKSKPQPAGDAWVLLGDGKPWVLSTRPTPQIPATLPRAPITVSSPDTTPIPLPVPRRGCWLLAGARGSGKTTAIQAILRGRGGTRIVLDPHDHDGKWPDGARVIGRSGDYDAIGAFLAEEMQAILTERTRRLGGGTPESALQADPIFVVIDELPAIIEHLGAGCMTSPRRWMYEMRKMGGDLLISTQSLRVRAMGLKDYGDIRQMFDFTLALRDVAQAQFPTLVEGMAWPAVLSTLTSARPVVIPQATSVIPAGDLDGDGDEDVIILPGRDGPLFTAPTPQMPKADPRNMRPEDMARIRALKAAGWSQRAIEEEMFGYTGGAAWEAVREALGADERPWRPAAAWPAPGQV